MGWEQPDMRPSRRALLVSAGAIPMLAACNRAKPKPVVDLFIETDGDFLAFKPDEISAPASSHIRLTFHHAGAIITQEHDWVLVFPGNVAAVDRDAQAKNGAIAPGDARVIAATPMCNKGESVMIEFDAPPVGNYPFFCSTPGHAETMRGLLHITET